jgi:tRNA (cmo5U34)-methyltransferase
MSNAQYCRSCEPPAGERFASEERSVGHGIVAPEAGWTFGGSVWQSFDQHIRASVPGYDALHDRIIELAQRFLGPGQKFAGSSRKACDLGCSTGTLTAKLARQFPNAQVLGVDIEPAMTTNAKRLCVERPHYVCADLRSLPLSELHLVTACYTLMFVPPRDRLGIIARIFQALLPGAGLVLAEKVKRRDPRDDADCQQQHHAFKRSQGLSERQIAAKSASLGKSLVPLYEDENLTLLERAGFTDIRLFSRAACFDAWLAVR